MPSARKISFSIFLRLCFKPTSSTQLTGKNFVFPLSKVRQATSHLSSVEKQLNEKTSLSGLHSAKLQEVQDEMETRSRRIRELEGALEVKDIELKESASLVDRVKALHSEQCHELQRQIEEVGN